MTVPNKIQVQLCPHIEEFIGEFNIPVNKHYIEFQILYNELRKKLRNKHIKHCQNYLIILAKKHFLSNFLRVDHLAGGLLFN